MVYRLETTLFLVYQWLNYSLLELKCSVSIATNLGECKSWTLDSGLDHGLDYGLEYGLNFRLIYKPRLGPGAMYSTGEPTAAVDLQGNLALLL